MKHFRLLIALFAIATVGGVLSLTSCKKEQSPARTNSSVNQKNINADVLDTLTQDYFCGTTQFYNGSQYGSIEDLDTNKALCIFYNGSAYYFDNDSLFKVFCTTNNLHELYEQNHNLDLIYAKAVELGIQDSDCEDINDVPENMKDYWKLVWGADFGTLPSEGPDAKFTWFTTVYDGMNYTGASKTCVGPTYWSLGSFNRKTTSFKVYNTGAGAIWWCHKKWYKKPRTSYLMVGLPVGMVGIPYVNSFNDNKYCSYISTIH